MKPLKVLFVKGFVRDKKTKTDGNLSLRKHLSKGVIKIETKLNC